MRLLGAVFVAFLASGPVSAQHWSVGGFGNVAFPALGHAPARGNPWGNVVSPAIPQGAAVASANRFGSLVTGFHSYHNAAGQGIRRNRPSGIYAYPVFVGGFPFAYGNGAENGNDNGNDRGGDQPPAPAPVVINQYFGTPPPDQGPPPDQAAESGVHYYQQTTASDDIAPSNPQSYYLIAFKDHTIYSAVAYYTEGDTLHYFTSGNVHNQVSLALVDTQLTEELNRHRNIDVRLPR